jgi:nitrate reductase molybdenum cofactor assembly chaperone NarJ/NarW
MVSTASGLDLIAQLFEYPTAGYRERITEAAAAIALTDAHAADLLGTFAEAIGGRSLAAMEELYIQTFDLNPDACLEVGWHLFGEDYARGEFLVKVRHEMRRYGVAEREELPDSLLCVLPLAARMAQDEAAIFRSKYLLPAVEKLRKAIPADSNPFAALCAALASLLTDETAEQGGSANE